MYFFENEFFSISSDLSPLLTGHLLVIPLKHYASFGEISSNKLIEEIYKKTEDILGISDLLYFEHGAVIEGEGGASIDHAHLHVMPRPKDLTIEMIDEYITSSEHIKSKKTIATHSTLRQLYKEKQPYIYYRINGEGWVYPVNDIPHQFLRSMLQKYSLISYDWRKTFESKECKENVNATIQLLKNTIK